jgi:hypothetical protein
VKDLVYNSKEGQVQYASIQVSGKTLPLASDSDSDGILDGEEAELGVDGWSTNPVLSDSDSDGVSDRAEVQGSSLCGSPTDPTRSDTDDDGFQDNIDIDSLGDVLIKVTFTLLYLADDVNGHHSPDLFIGIRSNGIDYFTERFDATHGENSTLNLSYYFDIWDCNSTMLFKITGVAHEAGSFPFNDDIKLDIGSDGGDDKEWWYTFNTAYSSQTVTNAGSDVSLTAKFEKIVQQKTNTIVVEGVQDNQTYGMTHVGTEYRYSADDQVILFYLDCSSSYSHFVSGTNVILLPRSVALESKLNDTLFGIDSITEANPLYGATFCYSDEEEASSSSHVIAVISNSVTGVQAESILAAITHDTMEGRVGNNISVTSSQLYLMHLPKDVLSHIPMMKFVNSNTSYAPEYLNWGDLWESLANTVVTAAEFVYNGIIAIAELYLDINRALIDIGLAVVGAFTAYYQTVIDNVIEIAETIVDVYMTFIDLAIELIQEIIDRVLSPIADMIWSLLDGQYQSMLLFSANAQCDIQDTGAVSNETKIALPSLLFGDFFWYLYVAAVAISGALMLMHVISGGFDFLLSIAVTMIAIELIKDAVNFISASSGLGSGDYGKSAIMAELGELLGSSPNENISVGMDVLDSCYGIFTLIPEIALFAILKDKFDLALTVSITLLAFMNLGLKDPIISVMTLGASLILLGKLYHDRTDLTILIKEPALINFAFVVAFSGIGVSSACLAIEVIE